MLVKVPAPVNQATQATVVGTVLWERWSALQPQKVVTTGGQID